MAKTKQEKLDLKAEKLYYTFDVWIQETITRFCVYMMQKEWSFVKKIYLFLQT